MEDTLVAGDNAIDPFNVLGVYSIRSDKEFNQLFNLIDVDKLIEQTLDCNVDLWLCKIRIDTGEFLDFQKSDMLIRLVWWLTFKLLYEHDKYCLTKLTSHTIDISEIISNKDSEYNELRIFVYKQVEFFSNYSYYLNIMLPNGGQVTIIYKNNNRL